MCRLRYPAVSLISLLLESSSGQAQQHIDHIVPWRLAERWGQNPHADWNLLSACQKCHGRKRRAEILLMQGRVREAIEELVRQKWWSERVQRAFKRFGLTSKAHGA